MITTTGDHTLFGMTFQALTRRDRLRLTQGDAVWWTTPQHHPDTHSLNLTQECYPVVFLLSSKIGGPEGFAPIPSSGELTCEGQAIHGVDFQIFFMVLECFAE